MKQLMRMLRISETAAIMCMAVGGLFVLLLAIGIPVSLLILPFEKPGAYTLGLLTGSLLSAVKVVLMEKSLNRSADMQSGSAQSYAGLMAILRYFLTIAVLVLVFFRRDLFGPFGAIFGILSLQAAAYITASVLRRRESKRQA